jgi:hypothetical protein
MAKRLQPKVLATAVTFMFAWGIPIARSLNSCESRGILLSLQVNSGELSICHRFVNKVVSLSMAVKVARAKVVKVYFDCLRR